MLRYEYNEDEVHEMFYVDGERKGKESTLNVVKRLVAGENPEDIIASGVSREDVEQAVEVLKLKV